MQQPFNFILKTFSDNSTHHAHGKLLLTAEYFVLDGAVALATPVKYGQSLIVSKNTKSKNLCWQSYDAQGGCWFEAAFHPENFNLLTYSDGAVAARLKSIFLFIKKQNPQISFHNLNIKTQLEFSRDWGLGTSSTLIYLLAKWAGVDAFELQFNIFGGSGYDIACAGADSPILYQKKSEKPVFEKCNFDPPFADNLYFIYLGKKQNSRDGIAFYEKNKNIESAKKRDLIKDISALTYLFLKTKKLSDFEKTIIEHENIVASYIGLEKVKDIFFRDYWGGVKSLGAWGGDFVLATSGRPEKETRKYFNEKGFRVFLKYKDMVLGEDQSFIINENLVR
ncbi:MAG TPA: GHMP kinase [Bacteroidetes bacterium]|nr:GHMP kinase [Bacteroidota bacterium]